MERDMRIKTGTLNTFAYSDDEYICWDPLSKLDSYTDLVQCSRRGMLTYGPNEDFFDQFDDDIDEATNRNNPLKDYTWSDALTLSAS